MDVRKVFVTTFQFGELISVIWLICGYVRRKKNGWMLHNIEEYWQWNQQCEFEEEEEEENVWQCESIRTA